MAVPYLLSGIFPKFWFRRRKRNRFLPKRVSSAVMFSTFGSGSCEEVHYCGKWFLRQWRYGVFSEEVWSSQRKGETCRLTSKRLILHSGWEKQVDFFSSLSPKAGRCVQNGNILYNSSRCAEVVHRRLWSGILNPPDDFSQLSFLKTLLSRTEAASRTLPSSWEGPGNRYCDQILTIGVAKMLERRRRPSSSGWDVVAALLHPRVGWVSYPDGIV